MGNPIKYQNLDLSAYGYRADADAERFRVYVEDSPAGQQKISEAEEVALDRELRQRMRTLEQRRLSRAELIALGEELAARLFPPRARQFLIRSRERIGGDQGLRIRLKLDAYALADLPWEFVYIPWTDTPPDQKGPEGFLALNRRISLVRYEVMGQAPGTLDPVGADVLRMVAILANPAGTATLDLDTERRNIEKALGGLAGVIRPEFFPNATVETLQDALLREAHVFHYAGHGDFKTEMGVTPGSFPGKGVLSLLGPHGEERPFPVENLAIMLHGRGVRLAVLGACKGGRRDGQNAWSGIAPALNRAGIPAVVGMQYTIRDNNAVAFSRVFYQALAVGQSIDTALIEGRQAIFYRSDNDERDWGVPVLYLRADEGVLFPRPASAANQPAPPAPAFSATSRSAAPTPASASALVDKRALRNTIVQAFSLEDLESLCADVQQDLADAGRPEQVNLEIVGGGGKTARVLNLIEYLDRRGLLPYLVKAVRSARPGII